MLKVGSYQTPKGFADVVSLLDFLNYTQGRGITAYAMAKGMDCSVHTARKVLSILAIEGLVHARMVSHRPNVDKTVYTASDNGRFFYQLMGFSLPSRKLL